MKTILMTILTTGLIAVSFVGCKATENSNSPQKPCEFQETKAEQKSTSRWKNKPMDELVSDAMHGDAAALHVLGMCYLYGLGGFPINIESANKYFAASASLGFAPSI